MKKISNDEVMEAMETKYTGFGENKEILLAYTVKQIDTIKQAYNEQQKELTLYRELDLDYLIRCLNMHDYGDDELYTKMYDLLIKIKGDEKE
jgi:hypothetical protein